MIPFMGETVCWVLTFFYFRDFAIVIYSLTDTFLLSVFCPKALNCYVTVLLYFDYAHYNRHFVPSSLSWVMMLMGVSGSLPGNTIIVRCI